jgi:protein-disulfide isomerase
VSPKDDDSSSSGGNDRNIIKLKKSTFNKLIIACVAALMVSSFFAGYNLHSLQTIVTPQPSLPLGQQQQQLLPQQQLPPQGQVIDPSLFGGGAGAGGGAIAPTPFAPPTQRLTSVSLDDDPIKGKSDASLTIVEFSDFQCPFCQRFAQETLPQILKEYVDTGKAKFVYRDSPFVDIHPNSVIAATAAQCANEQGKFWEYHDILFGNQIEWESQDTATADGTLKKYGADLQLNTDQFNSCLDSKKYEAEVNNDLQQGFQYGVSGTPTFFVGNDTSGYTQVPGALPFSAFQAIIEQES